jgi:hypothetical protein
MARFVGANHIDMTAATTVQPAVINTPATYRRHRGFFASVLRCPLRNRSVGPVCGWSQLLVRAVVSDDLHIDSVTAF